MSRSRCPWRLFFLLARLRRGSRLGLGFWLGLPGAHQVDPTLEGQ